jgi:hypothetical protein
MDVDRLVTMVCEYLVNSVPTQPHIQSKDADGTSRHAHLYREASKVHASDIMAFEFHRNVSPIVEAYHTLVARPVSAWGDAISVEQHKDAIAQLCYEFWLIAERHAPGQIAVPANRPMIESEVSNHHSDEGDWIHNFAVPSTDLVLYECQMNATQGWAVHMHRPNADLDYQMHHTVGPTTSVTSQRVNDICQSDQPKATADDTTRGHGGDAPVTHRVSTPSSTGAAYQRRAQFRITMETYQGRATHPVPSHVVDEVRDQIEASARHLIVTDATDPITRYARVTRVHVLSILRGMGNSRWYRESHHIHMLITGQAPPDISELQSTMLFMFDMGNLHRVHAPYVFFFTGHIVCKNRKNGNHVATNCATRLPKNICGGIGIANATLCHCVCLSICP